MSAIRPPEGDPVVVVWWKVSERNGGWDVVGLDVRDEQVYDSLHLHPSRADGVACGRQALIHAEGPSQ